MRAVDVIHKKRGGAELSREELRFLVSGYVRGDIPDYQMSAFLMAVCFQGMTARETSELTLFMADSGDRIDLSPIKGIKVDKHSTGGVGDKTTLIVLPVAAACGVTAAKMSGRGLGHTGGTIDKLESIPGFQTQLPRERFFEIVRDCGLSVIGQSGNICPADKKIYALRDVTATVESIPLIASSIMSKKIAAGADKILLDVKTGSGAFMKKTEDAQALAREMVEIGRNAGRQTVALITDMDTPLGLCVGNALEIIEVCDTLRGRGPDDLTELCLELAGQMIALAGKAPDAEGGKKRARAALEDGSAFEKLKEMTAAQGGDVSYLMDTGKFPLSGVRMPVYAPQEGYIAAIDAETCGLAAMQLGAGREDKESAIDHGAGIVIRRGKGAYVQKGDEIAVLYGGSRERCDAAGDLYLSALRTQREKPQRKPMVRQVIS